MRAKNYIDFNNEWNYPIQWIHESEPARRLYQCQLYRARLAMEGKSWHNRYKEEVESILKGIDSSDMDAKTRTACLAVPEGNSFALREAVQNRANQMSGGVDTYEYTINDPYMVIDPDTEDLLAAKCEQDYTENHLGNYASTFSRDITCYGVAAMLVQYDAEKDKNLLYRINPKNIWFDTMYSSTGKERFRGYSEMISFAKLKKMIINNNDIINKNVMAPTSSIFDEEGHINKAAKIGNKKIKTLNDFDIYIQDMNRLAVSPGLQSWQDGLPEYNHDLMGCYNLGWYHSFATDAKQKTNNGYNGDDVELTVIYDLDRMIEFKIINRRFVISANQAAFRRNIAFPIYDPIREETRYRVDEFQLQCPLKFQYEDRAERDAAPYPMAPIFPLLSVHDELCAWRAKRAHVSKLLSILRIETNGADATSLKKTMNIMGVILDDIQGDINSINFAYNYEPIDSEVQKLEDTIIRVLNAYNQFDVLQSMGDRASAAESGMANGAIAQGLAIHQDAIMNLYADIARQCIANRVAYSAQQEFPVMNLGQYSAVTIQQMALTAVIRVKSKLAKKAQEKMLSTNAITIASNFKDMLTPEGTAYFIEQAMMGQIPRKLASTFVKKPEATPEEIQSAQLQAQNEAQILKQNQQMYENNPIPYEVDNVMQSQSPDQIDSIIGELSGQAPAIEPDLSDQPDGLPPELLAMAGQDNAMQTNLAGVSPEMGSMMANPNAMA